MAAYQKNLNIAYAALMRYPQMLQILIDQLKKLPGVGSKTAERFAFDLLSWDSEALHLFRRTLEELPARIPPCPTCSCLTDAGVCDFCNMTLRDSSLLCLLSSPRDVYAVEATRTFFGLYHIIEHLLSPLDGRHVSALRLDRIEERIRKNNIKELILAFDSTLEGDTTALYLQEKLSHFPHKISRLAFGLPVGSSLDHIDGGTLLRAFAGRQTV